MADTTVKLSKRNDIGFTFEEVGKKTLPGGKQVPAFRGKPNDLEAHRRVIEYIEKDIAKSS